MDGRKASVEVEVEPELGIAKNSVSILKETLVTLCSVKLERANKEYLESFMKSLKATVEGSVTIRDTRYIISEDGKLAEFAGYVNVGTEDGYVICTSKGGQAVILTHNQSGTLLVNLRNRRITRLPLNLLSLTGNHPTGISFIFHKKSKNSLQEFCSFI